MVARPSLSTSNTQRKVHLELVGPLHLDDCLSKIQRPKIDEEKDYLFIVLHFPVFNRVAGVTVASEVDVFIGADYFITVHSGDIRPLRKMFQECQNDTAVCQDNGAALQWQLRDYPEAINRPREFP